VTRVLKAMLKISGGLAAGTALLAGLGHPVTVVAAIVMLALIAAICWIIADGSRTARLAFLISAARGQPAHRGAMDDSAQLAPARARPGLRPPVRQRRTGRAGGRARSDTWPETRQTRARGGGALNPRAPGV
jgi:hypothetical protein